MKVTGIITSAIVTIFLSSILNGYVLTVLWQWFVMAMFNAPELAIPHAIGLSMTVRFLTWQDIKSDTGDRGYGAKLTEAVFKTIWQTVVALSAGWIVTLFM